MSRSDRWSVVAAWVVSTSFLVGVGLFAYAGSFARYWADDYCYSAWVKQFGLLGGIADWYQTSGNRLSTLVFVALSDVLGRHAPAFVPAALLLLWVLAWFFFLIRLRSAAGWQLPISWLVALSLALVFFAVLLAPDRLQSVYWRMGSLHYTLPAPLLLLNAGLLVGWLNRPARLPACLLIGSGLLAVLSAGLSETFAALQAGASGIGLLAAAFLLSGERRPRAIWLLLPALVASLFVMVVMIFAPANAWRQAAMPAPDPLWLVIPYSFRYALAFVFYTVRGQVVPFVVYLAVVGAIGLLVRQSISFRATVVAVLGPLLIMYGVIVCSFAPSAYAGLAYPAGRALMPGLFVLLAGLGSAAFFAASGIARVFPINRTAWFQVAATVAVLAASLYPLRSAAIPLAEARRLAAWSERWDARDQQIRGALLMGEQDLRVREVEVVQTLGDIGPDPAFWINVCAAMFYDVQTVTALP